ncbi:MAG TPA: GNAT family N-acetyltransferase [Pyrinomonadaceae bacterium]|nr:GNAT family N-acetyltransferase [Pyrinomonadaceae bacterium]
MLLFETDYYIWLLMTYSIIFEENPSSEKLRLLGEGIDRHTQSKFGDRISRHIAFFLQDEAGEIVGGVYGKYGSFGWLYISALWVSENVRGCGHGARLMNAIEREACKNGCVNAYLDTFSFQAPEFYKKLGYTVFGELEDFPAGHSRIFMRKSLTT